MMENLASGHYNCRFGAEKWAQKKNPFFTGKVILAQGVGKVNKNFLKISVIFTELGVLSMHNTVPEKHNLNRVML